MISIRALRQQDLTAADEVLRAAFAHADSFRFQLERCLEIQRDAFWVAEWRGEIAGMVGVVHYGPMAYVGFMAVSPDRQRLGIGGALMEHLIQDSDRRGCPTLLLEATDEGEPLYRRLGFELTAVSVDFRRNDPERPLSLPCLAPPVDFRTLAEIDRHLFCADRGALLQRLYHEQPSCALLAPRGDGYLIAQARLLGPWMAADEEAAEALITASLELPCCPPRVVIPEENRHGRELVSRYGFSEVRRMAHMRRGAPSPGRFRAHTYGMAGPAFG